MFCYNYFHKFYRYDSYMIVFVACFFSFSKVQSQPIVTLTTNQTLPLYSSNAPNQNFTLKTNNFDCSSLIYTYTQSQQQYILNTPLSLSIENATSVMQLSVSTLYSHFQPTLSQNLCQQTSCNLLVYHNCPSDLNNENYFDVIQISISNLGTFSYYLKCSRTYNPIYMEWGQLIITICATIILAFSSVFSKLSSFGNFALQYDAKWVTIVVCFFVFLGFMTIFLPYVASVMFDVLSWIIGTIGVGLIAIEIMYKFVKLDVLRKQKYIKEIRIRVMDVVGAVIGLALCFGWWFSGKNWILNDIIALCMTIVLIKAFKFVSFKIGLISYLILNIFSIIGAVLTSLLHKENYIVYFILSVNNPFQFQVPLIIPSYNQRCVFVSITAIFLPGLLVSYLRRFDRCRTTNIYLITTVSCYFFGSLIWNLINILSNTPIPFDLIVQAIMMIAFCAFAFKRKELRTIWEGTFYDEQFVHKVEIEMLNQRLSVQVNKGDDALRDSIANQLFFNIKQDQLFKEKFQDKDYLYKIMKDPL